MIITLPTKYDSYDDFIKYMDMALKYGGLNFLEESYVGSVFLN